MLEVTLWYNELINVKKMTEGEPQKRIGREELSSETIPAERVVKGEELRAILSEKELEGLIRDYVEETYHHPDVRIAAIRTKIEDILDYRIELAKFMYHEGQLFGLEKKGKIVSIGGFKTHWNATKDGGIAIELRSMFTPKEFREKGYNRTIMDAHLRALIPVGAPLIMNTESAVMIKLGSESGFRKVDEDEIKKHFTELFQEYLLGNLRAGYDVLVRFPSPSGDTI